MSSTTWGMARVNWRHNLVAYLIAAIVLAAGAGNYVTWLFVTGTSDNETTAVGDYLMLLPLGIALFICARNFHKLMNLGGTRMDFFRSGWLTFTPAAVVVAAIMVVLNRTLDPWMLRRGAFAAALDVLDAFGFTSHGAFVAFLQMAAWLTGASAFVWTLTLIQGRWYGWVADALIIAVISVFTPIAPLRAVLVWFFHLTIFGPWLLQIVACLVLGALVYAASLVPIRSTRL
jgi:hypothetical protein